MTAYKVFTCIAYYAAVRLNMALFLPSSIHSAAELQVSIKRIEDYLLINEHTFPALEQSETTPESNVDASPAAATSVKVDDIVCDWLPGTTILHNVSFNLRAGQLLMVAGPVGSGKSTLLMSLLGELKPTSGLIAVSGRVAYASQEPWILSLSVRDNILFGEKYDADWYQRVIASCALVDDLNRWPAGDETEVGERGVTLSGGQKARISLARAIYSNRDIILLDDPLSAVDTRVGKHIFQNVIKGICKDKICILVTHQEQYLPFADQVLLLAHEGHVAAMGDYNSLMVGGHIDPKEFGFHDSIDNQLDVKEGEKPVTQRRESDGKLFKNEVKAEGVVKLATYKRYWAADSGWGPFVMVFSLLLITELASIVSNWFMSYWVQLNVTDRSKDQNVIIYSCIVLFFVVVAFWRGIYFFNCAIASSRYLHTVMFEAVIGTRILFFDSNPVGRILNRFNKDLGLIDDYLPITYMDMIQAAFMILGLVLFVSIVNPWIFILTVPMLAYFVWLRNYYLYAGRDIKRIEANCRSPIYSHLSSSLIGIPTIRCHNASTRFSNLMESHLDHHGRAFYMFMTANRWLGVRLDLMSGVFAVVVAYSAIAARNSLPPGLAGLSLAYALMLTGWYMH